MLEGFRQGSAGTGLTIYALLSAMRTAARSLEIAELAVRWRDAGVVGFDIAGAEAGYPPTRHLDAFQFVQRENFHATIHAGEAFGLPSIWEALQWCGAERLGHGVRIVDDITAVDGQYQLGRLAAYVRDRRIPLEMCPTSNVNTGVVPDIASHPIGLLRRLRFRVTVNTDNRLMSDTSMTNEFRQLRDAFGYGWDDFEWLTVNAMKSAFAPFDERLRIINERIKPQYALLKVDALACRWRLTADLAQSATALEDHDRDLPGGALGVLLEVRHQLGLGVEEALALGALGDGRWPGTTRCRSRR